LNPGRAAAPHPYPTAYSLSCARPPPSLSQPSRLLLSDGGDVTIRMACLSDET